jgi:hypothetical protein
MSALQGQGMGLYKRRGIQESLTHEDFPMARSKSYAVMSFEALIKIRDDVTEALADRADTLRDQLSALAGVGGKSRGASARKQRKVAAKAAKKAVKKAAKKAAKKTAKVAKKTAKKTAKRATISRKPGPKRAKKPTAQPASDAGAHSPAADGGGA